MTRLKSKLQWIWDWHFKSMEPSGYFLYMEAKYGQVWLDHVDRKYQRRFE